MSEQVIAFGPASVANVGPFYDVMGYCLNHLGDIVIASKTREHQDAVLQEVNGPFSQDLAEENVTNQENCVQIVANEIWRNYGAAFDYGIDLTLYKMMPTQSGLGSSASSCVSAAKAVISIMGIEDRLEYTDIANCIISGEKASSDHYYPDNVVPSYWGGFHIISHRWKERVMVKNFYTIIILQRWKNSTKVQRESVENYFLDLINSELILDAKVDKILHFLRYQARGASRLVNALTKGEFKAAGQCISQPNYNFLEEARSESIPNYERIKETALKAGAYGCSISGSGPSVFAITDEKGKTEKIRDAIISAIGTQDVYWLISPINDRGATLIPVFDKWVAENKGHHNFWDKR